MKKPTFVVVGAGGRGFAYAEYVRQNPDAGQAVAVCEPREAVRARFADRYGVPAAACFADWRDLLGRPRLADAAFVCTVEDLHRDIAVALADKGYHLLLEKPMAPTQEACCDIYGAAQRNGIILAVCHVLRYVSYIHRLKEMLDAGLIGRVWNLSATELVGAWHFTHSFVRGNFRNEATSSSFLLAKCCHDMDLLNYLMPGRCAKVSSFGRLSYFTRANQPKGAADRCTDCPAEVESTCPYSALKIYLRDRFDRLDKWPVNMLTVDTSPAGVARALREGPYGRCVYACDNDVADHQVVNLEFESGATASFVTTAFATGSRDYFAMGEKGWLRLNDSGIHHHDFLTGKTVNLPLYTGDQTQASGHGGGDHGLARAFLEAVRDNDPGRITTGPDVSLESHLIVFAAERARKRGTVEAVPDLRQIV